MAKSKRKRVSREQVRSNVSTDGKRTAGWFNLPKGVESWLPEKATVYMIDIVPYEVKTDNHPDGVEAGTIWYKYPFAIHHGVGLNEDSFVCPLSVGERCPLCEESKRLAKEDYEANKAQISALRPQKFVAYNILNPDDDTQVALFAMSKGKFAEALEQELQVGDDENLQFFDVTEEGRTLKVRFSEDEFMKRKYLKATRVDFRKRDEMDEDEILERTVCLDEMFNVPSYEKLKSLMEGEEENDPEPDEEEEEEERPKKGRKPSKPRDEEEEDEEEEEPAPPPKKKSGKKTRPEPDEEEDEDDDWTDDFPFE